MSYERNGIPFTDDGWLDIRGIKKRCPEAVFFWIIGARQIGKTYGLLDYMHDFPTPYIFMRHNDEELKYANSAKINMFADRGLPWADSTWNEKGKPTFSYNSEYHDGKLPKVLSTSLRAVGKIRGIPCSNYTHIFFDEFIPVNSLTSREEDGQFLQDFYLTVNGVRETQGKPPVEMWCCANSNSLASPILAHWGLTGEFMRMIKKGQNFKYIPKRRLCLINCDNSPKSEELQRGAMWACMGLNNDYADMALHNRFVDDDEVGVTSKPLVEYAPMCSIDSITLYKHKNREELYIVENGEPTKVHFSSKNKNSFNAFNTYWKCYGLPIPVDGENIFYNSYVAKIAAYKLIKF